MTGSISEDEQAGAIEPFRDAALYDWEYRRRRHDIAFYRMLAHEQGGPVLDLGCGTGRLTVPLLRDGHRVVGVDLSPAMLARAGTRLRRLARPVAARALLVRGDLRSLPVRGHFPMVIAAFHTVQHLVDDHDLISMFRRIRQFIRPGGWFVFDVFAPHPRWLARPPRRQFDRTVFRHPITGQSLAYSVSHRLDHQRQALHMKLRYQPLANDGTATGRAKVVRLCHRQLPPRMVKALLRRSGLEILARWAGFDGEVLPPQPTIEAEQPFTEQHIYLARAAGGRAISDR